ncbi:hypothetical protein [Neoaquamicrobium sediminum]|uniref:hypothetical protein n=1 Tax=Neoaquamicrobium sediminum TaxID=1849104 RepID=UPI003BABD8F8
MKIDPKLAARAHKLSQQGLKGKAMGEVLGVSTTEANQLAAVGAALASLAKKPLTPSEILLLRMLAKEHRDLLAAGETRSPKSDQVSWLAGKSDSWCAATARKRIFVDRWDEKLRRTVHGRGLVDVSGNGYVHLTPAGWGVVFAMEEAAAAVAAPLLDALTEARKEIDQRAKEHFRDHTVRGELSSMDADERAEYDRLTGLVRLINDAVKASMAVRP